MRTISLSQGKVALVSDEDYALVAAYQWHAFKIHRRWYAATHQIARKRTYLHRFIMQPDQGMEVDHINGDGLDNRRENLRVCTHRDNLRNMHRSIPSRSGYRGVGIAHSGRFTARCKYEGKMLYFGTFDTAEEAARVRDQEVIKLHGEFAYLNFPLENYEPTG